ncbi:hypothetical protein H6G96_25660 [Nostoc sp. FACHB-892]|uniref:hypothetical protein n=1 Tax=Nostoc sp. FACHB-892 TaxID=2692843 RepID=UPI0016836BB1|nr:hypothetical protein [Nostoc sp. FACHB-892]MBD2729609.1 hypothetical protein [Nostoc sp. FACHB-892]
MKRPQFIAAIAIFLITHATNLQIPLYGTYAKMAGFGSGISAIALAWSLAGIVGVILPTQLARYGLPNWAGLMLFIITIAGVMFQPFARRLEARRSLQIDAVLLVAGYFSFIYGAWLGHLGLVLAGVAIAGTACNCSFDSTNRF